MNRACIAFCWSLPFRFVVVGGRDRHGHLYVSVARRDVLSSPECPFFSRGAFTLVITWGGWPAFALDRHGLGLGRLWIDWS